jgi:CheY-like chemotaxis protein
MPKQGPAAIWRTSPLVPVLTFLIAAGIFLADTISPIEIGFAALYVAVVTLSVTFLNRQGVLVVGLLCLALTSASFAIVHGSSYQIGPLIRYLVALFTIGVTTFVARKYQQVMQEMHEPPTMLSRASSGITSGPVFHAIADDLAFSDALNDLLRSLGLQVKLTGSATDRDLDKLADTPNFLVLEIRLADVDGLDLPSQFSKGGTDVPVVFMTKRGDNSGSVKAIKEPARGSFS